MSVSLPYDAARFEKADAIMVAYLAWSMPVDPGDKTKEITQYGPNMPAALYMMFSADDAPTAKLPIHIPKLDDAYNYTDRILYERGFGLTYQSAPVPDTPILGDADSDGKVTVLDVTAIQKKIASIETFSFSEDAADVDRDGKVTILDATYIQKYLASMPCPDGIVSLMTADYSGFGTQQQAKYEVVKANGMITEMIQYAPDGDGEWAPFTKCAFEYNDTEISAQRYSLMINDFIANHGGNYYIFNWY